MSGRVLVARLDSMGDVLLAGPAIRAIAAHADEVWVLCSGVGAPAAELLPGVTGVLVWDCPWITASAPPATPEHMARLDDLVTAAQPDAAVILTSFHQSPLPLALHLRQAGVPFIAGISTDFAGSLLDVRLRPGEDLPEDLPEPERALRLAAAAGFPAPAGDDGRLRMAIGTAPDAVAGIQPFVAVHPGASAPARRWPSAHHAALVRMLHEAGVPAVVTGGEAEKDLTREVSGGGRYALDGGGIGRLATLGAVIAAADVLVTGNTGPAHVAAAVGTPVVSLFSPVVPAERWAPYRVPHILLGDQQAPCRLTRAVQCPVPGHPCLTAVRPEQVLAACLRLAPRLARGDSVEAAR